MGVYLKIDGAEGDVTEVGHKKWIEVIEAEWNMNRSVRSAVGVGKNRESSSAKVSEMTIWKFIDSSSHKMLSFAFCGQAKQIQIDFTRVYQGGESVYRTIELKDAIIAGLTNKADHLSRATEHLNLNFTRITVSDYGEDSTGKRTGPSRVIYDLSEAKTL